jgi:hypothetical protein
MVLPANSPQKVNALACNTRRFALILWFLQGLTLSMQLLKPTYWPNPPYSEEARKNKLEGSRRYDVFFDAQGNPLLIIAHRPLKPEFDDIAIEMIKTWKARPATMQVQPVAVCTTIEMNWRLY